MGWSKKLAAVIPGENLIRMQIMAVEVLCSCVLVLPSDAPLEVFLIQTVFTGKQSHVSMPCSAPSPNWLLRVKCLNTYWKSLRRSSVGWCIRMSRGGQRWPAVASGKLPPPPPPLQPPSWRDTWQSCVVPSPPMEDGRRTICPSSFEKGKHWLAYQSEKASHYAEGDSGSQGQAPVSQSSRGRSGLQWRGLCSRSSQNHLR